jgi:uncharacterized protein
VLLPVEGEAAERIMKANPGVFHKTVFPKGAYSGVDADVPAIAITAVLNAMENFPEDRVYQIVSAIFANLQEISAVWKGALKLIPEQTVAQLTPDAVKFIHPGAAKFFKEKGALK